MRPPGPPRRSTSTDRSLAASRTSLLPSPRRGDRLEQALDGFLPRADAVGDPDAAVGAADHGEARMPRHSALDRLHPSQVADVILRHRLLIAGDAGDDR